MPTRIFEVVFPIYMAVVLLSVVVRHATAVAALKRAGAPASTGYWTWHLYPEMRAYRDLCVREGKSLRWWKLWWGLHLSLWVGLAGIIALSLADG